MLACHPKGGQHIDNKEIAIGIASHSNENIWWAKSNSGINGDIGIDDLENPL